MLRVLMSIRFTRLRSNVCWAKPNHAFFYCQQFCAIFFRRRAARAHRASRSAAPGPRRPPLRNPQRNFDANKNSGNSRGFLQHADATGSFACCRARRRRHPGARTRACPQAEKNFSRRAPFRHRTRANAQNCANFFALFGACERACAAPRTASRRRRRCRCSVRMSAHAPHRHITRTRPDASRSLLPPRPPRRACPPRPTRRTAHARATPNPPDRTNECDAAGRNAASAAAIGRCLAHDRLRCTSPSLPKNRRVVAAFRCRCSDVAFLHTAIIRCASLRAVRPHPPPGVPHPRLWRIRSVPRRPLGNAERRASAPARQTSRIIETRSASCIPAAAFFCAAQTKTGRTRRPVRLSRREARLSGRLPRAARRSRPASASRSTAPDLRSPARRSSLRRTRPR